MRDEKSHTSTGQKWPCLSIHKFGLSIDFLKTIVTVTHTMVYHDVYTASFQLLNRNWIDHRARLYAGQGKGDDCPCQRTWVVSVVILPISTISMSHQSDWTRFRDCLLDSLTFKEKTASQLRFSAVWIGRKVWRNLTCFTWIAKENYLKMKYYVVQKKIISQE